MDNILADQIRSAFGSAVTALGRRLTVDDAKTTLAEVAEDARVSLDEVWEAAARLAPALDDMDTDAGDSPAPDALLRQLAEKDAIARADGCTCDRTPRIAGPSTYTVIAYTGDQRTNENESDHGSYDTLEEAMGCVAFDGLSNWEVWHGDIIVAEGGAL